MARMQRLIGWGLCGLLALTLAACGADDGLPPATEPDPNATLGLAASPLITLGQLQARAIYTYGQNGWVHIIERVSHDLDREPFSTLPDGTPVPRQHVLETWANITGPQSVVTQRVIFLRDDAGQLLQTSVLSNGVAWNSATQKRENQAETATGAFDRGFGASVGEYERIGAKVTQASGTLSGTATIEILVDYAFDQPAKYEDYTEAVAAETIRAIYDPDGGQIRQLVWMMRLVDGSERAYGVWDITLENHVSPPDAVLEALKVVAP